MTWTLEFRMQVHASFSAYSTEDVDLSYKTELPFVPSNDLVVKVNNDLWLKVEGLHWFAPDLKFVSHSEDKQFYNPGMRTYDATAKQEMWDHVQENYLALGWKVRSGGMLWPRCPDHGVGMEPAGTPVGGPGIPQWWCRRSSNIASHFVSEARIDLGYEKRTVFND